MGTIPKIVVSVAAWMAVTLAVAAAIEVTYGTRPALISRLVVLLLAPLLVALWWPKRPRPRWVRELVWPAVIGLVVALYIDVRFALDRSFYPNDLDWFVVWLFAGVYAVRLAVAALRNHSRVTTFTRTYQSQPTSAPARTTPRDGLQRGLLRLWIVLNVPLAAYFAYDAFSSHTCFIEASNAGDFWAHDLPRRVDRAEKYRAGVAEGLPEWQLPVFFGPPEQEVDEARENLVEARREAIACKSQRLVSLVLGVSVPALSLAAVFAAVWVRTGFTGRR